MANTDLKAAALPCAMSAAAASLLTLAFVKATSSGGKKGRGAFGAAVDPKEEQKENQSNTLYETNRSAQQYMEFHFTHGSEIFKPYDPHMKVQDAFDFPLRVARVFKEYNPKKTGRVLDLGCAVGMSSFELTKFYSEVVGLDLSEAFIDCANKLATTKKISYEGPDQGLKTLPRSFTLDKAYDTKKVRFEVGDAMDVDPALGTFDGLLAANLLCRVPEPEKLLRSFAKLLNVGGILVLVSPYSWWEGATDKDKWIGGKPGDERSESLVQRILESVGFMKLNDRCEPFLIRDHHRRFQLGFSHCTVWERKKDF